MLPNVCVCVSGCVCGRCGVCARMRLCMAVCACVWVCASAFCSTRLDCNNYNNNATICSSSCGTNSMRVCVLAILLFNSTHTQTHIHTCKLHPYFNGSQAKYRYIPMMKLHVAKCATAAHAHMPQPHLALSFPYLAAPLPLLPSLSPSLLSFISHLWLLFSACCKMTNFTLCPHWS